MSKAVSTNISGIRPNLKQLLIARADWFARELEDEISLTEYSDLSPAESRLLAHMAGKPCNMAELARRLGVSQQAVHKTVSGLSGRGILTLTDDPDRGNAKLVLYTDLGRQVNRAGARIIERIEERIATKIGPEALEQLRELLARPW